MATSMYNCSRRRALQKLNETFTSCHNSLTDSMIITLRKTVQQKDHYGIVHAKQNTGEDMNTYLRNDETNELKNTGPADCDRQRILIVDDQKAIRDVFKLVISCSLPACQVDMAEDGMQAVEIFKKEHDGILLMDLNMPVMDGKAAFHEIEKICQVENCQMPSVLFCTGYQSPAGPREIIQNNSLHGLLLKPVSGHTLITEIKKRLEPQHSVVPAAAG